MRGLMVLVLLVLVLPTLQSGPSSPFLSTGSAVGSLDTASSVDQISLLITEVCPGRPVEFVTITNMGPTTSLQDAVIGDGEGTIRVKDHILLETGSSFAVTANATVLNELHPGLPSLQKGGPGLIWGGRFTLADDGDQVWLSVRNTTVDLVLYGDAEHSGPGWSGPALGPIPRAHSMVRIGGDSDTSGDWSIEPPGRSSLPVFRGEAIVEPFSAPENAMDRILRELALARSTVNVSVYELSDPSIVWALVDCARRGVEVNVLIEGQPVGGISERSLNATHTLNVQGVNVKQLRSHDSYKRYDYLHAKYMVVDSRRVLVTSENWGPGLLSNRGWGVVMDGREVGRHYERVFRADLQGGLDVFPPLESGSVLSPLRPEGRECVDLERHRCEVTALLAPDNAHAWLASAIENATGTILVEQLSVDEDWLDGPTLVGSLISAASRGVTVRLLMDSSWGGRDNPTVAKELNRQAQALGLDLEAKVISPYHGLSVMHNKGVIIDDLVIISSLNWGDTSLYQNREVGAAISSPEVTSFFRSLFWQDWALDPIPPTIDLPWTYLRVEAGVPVLLDGGSCTDNAPGLHLEWDVGGDGSFEGNSTAWTVRLPEGNHTIVLTARDLGNNSVKTTIWVEVMPDDRGAGTGPSFPVLSVPLLAIVLLIGWKTIIGRKGYR